MKQTDQQRYEQEVKTELKRTPGIPLNGCLYLIILGALACISVKGCKMVNMKYEEQKAKHELYMDSLNKINPNIVNYKSKQK